MASPISTSTFLCTSSVSFKSTTCSLSPLVSYPKASSFRFSTWFPQLGPALFSQWSGLKHLGKVVHASLFGVGAPEAMVIGVVSLLVFGPKGLTEVVRNLGKTLRAFQPTIKNFRKFQGNSSTLELCYMNSDGTPSGNEAYTSEEYLKITKEQLKASASQQQGQTASPGESQLESQNQHESTPKKTAAAMPPSQKPESES